MSRFSLTVLVDNMTLADRYFIGEPGLSFLIHTDQETILFDTGYSEVFLSNAQKMGKSLLDLDYVVFSHGHLDHTGGISALIRHMTEAKNSKLPCKIPRIISYLLCFCPRPKFPHPNVGSPLRDEEIKRYFPTNLSEKPVWITEDLVFLGEIPRGNSYEKAEAGNRMIILPDAQKCLITLLMILLSRIVLRRVSSLLPGARTPGFVILSSRPGKCARIIGLQMLSGISLDRVST